MTVSAGYADQVLAVTSSHFGSAEKQFRFPLGYGNQRPLSATWTVTGSGAFLLSAQKSHAKSPESRPGESSGLRCEGFSEYGSLHGTGSGRYDLSESDGF